MRIQHLIDGRSHDSRATFETINPATQEVLAEVADGGADEVNAAVAAAKAAFPAWAARSATERATLMRKVGDLIAKHVPDLSRTETQDTGQVIAQTGKQLVPRAADNFYYFAEMCTRVDGHTYPTPTHLNYTLYHPVGVCALISPWNVPFMTATWKTAPCLAFGNTAVLKMSELSPMTLRGWASRAQAGVKGVFNVVHGTARALASRCARTRRALFVHWQHDDRQPHRADRGLENSAWSWRQSPVIFDDADRSA
jgi:5-carboxymethyl-2-hydroxymuconic-semialdehyde dehydrogenase